MSQNRLSEMRQREWHQKIKKEFQDSDEIKSKTVSEPHSHGRGRLGIGGRSEGRTPGPRRVPPASSPGAWKFGVMNDTQWTVADDGYDPDTCAVGILKQIQRQFIAQRVKFVVHVGDLCDSGAHHRGRRSRAVCAAALRQRDRLLPACAATTTTAPPRLPSFRLFIRKPRTAFITPRRRLSSITAAAAVPSPDDANLGIPAIPDPGSSFQIGVQLQQPRSLEQWQSQGPELFVRFRKRAFHPARPVHAGRSGHGLSPAYDSSTTIGAQQPWITSQLQNRYAGSHAFVFAHKGLITCQHADVLFGSSPNLNPTLTDAFINSLASNGVRYFIHGHDHMYDRSFVTTTTNTAKDNCRSSPLPIAPSSTFRPGSLTNSAANGGKSNDDYYDVPAFGIRRRQPLSQQLNSVGFQIVTVDGANVTVDYYAAVVPIDMSLSINKGATSELQIPGVSSYTFTKQETFGYSLVRQGVRGCGGRVLHGACRTIPPRSPLAARLSLRFSPASPAVRRLTPTAFPWRRRSIPAGRRKRSGSNSRSGGALASDIFMSLGYGCGAGLRRDGYVRSLLELRFGAQDCRQWRISALRP